jgi:hypothetical protein
MELGANRRKTSGLINLLKNSVKAPQGLKALLEKKRKTFSRR